MSNDRDHLISAADPGATDRQDMRLRPLSEPAGMRRLQIVQSRLAPSDPPLILIMSAGAEAFIHVIGGQGILAVGDDRQQMRTGDTFAITAPECAPSITNTGTEDLIWISGTGATR